MGFLIKLKGKKLEEIQPYLEIAVDKILEGNIIAFPTDSVYGIGGDPLNYNVIDKIYKIKFRDKSKGLLLLVSDLEEAAKIAEFNELATRLAKEFWPGQLTLILKRKEPNIIPQELTAFKDTIGLRIPSNEILSNILKILKLRGFFGGIIGTSANYSGESPSISGDEVAKKFLSPIDLIIDGGKSKSKVATTIIKCTSETPEFLRIGKITEEQIQEMLKINN
ncbi:MAG: L-threonylcarbamoyladenylate synthase [Candidatus Thorarchaeota archaeon]